MLLLYIHKLYICFKIRMKLINKLQCDHSHLLSQYKSDVQVHTKVHANISRSPSLTTSYYELGEV